MLQERIKPAWVDALKTALRRCAPQPGDCAAILGESQSGHVVMAQAHRRAARLGSRAA